ncbi:MAG TPA: type VII secretion target [Amycolatopsis sp.]|uniref:type VII secretion target n=1 Tax=Amycolatopsis sp. TaxID=37632 RepID=UPI002B480E7A|nr:type VII secretion target [Amycolatopsis sp.]HKS45005.1 type VII secretion target [Amycolatopsis sp.]
MGQGGFEVGSDLEAHASQLDGLTDQLNQAVDAARQVSMPTDAYGILCQPFRVLLDPVEQYGINALQDAVTAMESVADKVRKTAQAYQDNDSGVGTTLKQYEA